MPTTVTINSTVYPTIGTVADAILYLQSRVGGTTFTGAGAETQAILVKTATDEVENWLNSVCPDIAVPRGLELSDQPEDLRFGVYELALLLGGAQGAALLGAGDTGSNVKRAQAGSASVEFFKQGSTDASRWPPLVMSRLVLYARSQGCSIGGSGAGGGESFGTGNCSGLPRDNFGLTEGY